MIDNDLNNNLLKTKRQRTILNLLTDKGTITLKELEEKLSCSRITIQRDLVALEEKGLLDRVHGGATTKEYNLASHDHHNRLLIHTNKKKKICRKAVTLIEPNTIIFMDASSTVFFMSEYVFPEKVRAVTTGYDTFLALQKIYKIQPILTGGRINPDNRTLVGPEAVHTAKQFYFDAVFISADSVIENQGVYSSDSETAEISSLVIRQTNKVFLLFDSSKEKNRQGAKVCRIGEITKLITDEPDNQYLKKLFKGNIL